MVGDTCLWNVLDTILDCAPGDPSQVCDFIVPILSRLFIRLADARYCYRGTHVPLLNVPSLLSDIGIQLPASYAAGVVGGRRRGDHVKLRDNMTLVLYAKVIDCSTSSSCDAEEDESANPPSYTSPEQAGPDTLTRSWKGLHGFDKNLW